MSLSKRVEVRPKRGESLRQVTKDMDCNGVLALWEALKLTNYGSGCILGRLETESAWSEMRLGVGVRVCVMGGGCIQRV